METANEFIIRLRSLILDALNNHLMQIQKVNLNDYYETREDLIGMLESEAGFLEKKRDSILKEINVFLDGSS